MISEDKGDPNSGSESSASEEHSQQSLVSSNPIISAFSTSANARKGLSSNGNDSHSIASLAASDGFSLGEARNHNIAHFTTPSAAGFFPNGGHLAHGGLHLMTAGSTTGNYTPGSLTPTSPLPHNGRVGGENGGGSGGTEANRKRAVRLQKNREAARECRRKKKEYIKCLENRVAVLENQNKALIEELRSLKELYSGKSYNNHDVRTTKG